MKKPKPRCAFKTDAEETKFRETHDSADYIDWSKAERALSKPEALDHSNLNASAAPLAGADQDRRQQARRAVSVPDQDVAGGKGGAVESERRHRVGFLYFTGCGIVGILPCLCILSFSNSGNCLRTIRRAAPSTRDASCTTVIPPVEL